MSNTDILQKFEKIGVDNLFSSFLIPIENFFEFVEMEEDKICKNFKNIANSFDELFEYMSGIDDYSRAKVIRFKKKGYYEKIISLYEKLPNRNIENLNNEAIILLKLRKLRDAKEYFDNAIKLSEEEGKKSEFIISKIYNNKAIYLVKIKSYEEAKQYFDKAISLDPKNSVYYTNKAILLKIQNKNKEAIAFCDKALSYNKNSSGANYCKGLLSRPQEAIIYFQKVIDVEPFREPIIKNLIEILKCLSKVI